MSHSLTIQERFWKKVESEPNSGCWLWIGELDRNGYGVFSITDSKENRLRAVASVFAYELLKGPVAVGQELDHLCRVRSCVNPRHLEAVTHRENLRRGYSPSGVNARKSYCMRGHLFDYVYPSGKRACKTCRRNYLRIWRKQACAC